jgi:hypothetical protein
MQHFHVERTTRAVIVVYMRGVYIGIRGFSHFYDGFVAVARKRAKTGTRSSRFLYMQLQLFKLKKPNLGIFSSFGNANT